jgi:NADH-quinone oxidoreductase subunit G
VLYTKGEEVLRVSARKDKYGEVKEFICNECRFEHKNMADWIIEGPQHVDQNSVISQNHYEKINLLNLKKEVERQIIFEKGKQLPNQTTS